MMEIDVITLFPSLISETTTQGVVGRAFRDQLAILRCWNPRDFTEDKHRTVDDRPYGGGPGMLMQVGPLQSAITAAKKSAAKATEVVYLSPQGEPLKQQHLDRWSTAGSVILLCGRYEGVDERLIEQEIDTEISLGDFVLSGGEPAASVIIDGIVRLLPGALGHSQSAQQDSFAEGLLDHPHYTRPEVLDGKAVPKVLLSGDHEKIRVWRLKESLRRTWLRRPDLLEGLPLTEEQQHLIAEVIRELEQ